ncbi:MAG: branched-chain amino acid ABC transporter permease [Rhizobiales bacterium]|nr:branched-chain amino acid ABC transporter permease [Hyphomicrobiales bacterium]
MNVIFTQFLAGLQVGAIYALIALGLTLIFGTLGVVNFAHGALYIIGSYIAVLLLTGLGLNFWLVLILTAMLLFFIGIVLERGLMRHFYNRPHTDQILVTFGLAIVVQEALRWRFGANPLQYPIPSWAGRPTFFYGAGATPPEGSLAIPMPFLTGFVPYPTFRLTLILVAVLTVLALFALLRFTKFGLTVRAGMRDPEMLRFLGVNITQKFSIVFGIGALIAGVAGVFGGPIVTVSPDVGMALLVPSFLVVVIGGMGSMIGALVAAVLIGMASSFSVLAQNYTSDIAALIGADSGIVQTLFAALQQIVIYLVAVIVLLVRPRGLFGKKGVFE